MLIDSHCHIPHRKYQKSIEYILKDGEKSGVSKFITIGTSLSENTLVKEVSEKYNNIYYTVGVYPHEEMNKDINTVLEDLEKNFLIGTPEKLVGIGECGIDVTNWSGGRSIEDQKYLFEKQIQLCIKYNLPLVIHNRNGNDVVLNLLTKYVPLGLTGVIHCFDADWDFASKIIDLGFYLSFSGLITYPKKDMLLDVVRNVPLDKFLVETDAPYLPPVPYRGQVNYSEHVKVTAQKVADIKGIDLSLVENYSYENTSKLFNI